MNGRLEHGEWIVVDTSESSEADPEKIETFQKLAEHAGLDVMQMLETLMV